ncbi:MAG: UDP-4-amino-4,6-dideoxy-N-acetyl-beta-L-altrosamine transaminase [Candidatus Omnitrophota bacterium]
MTPSLIPYGRQWLNAADTRAVQRVLRSDFLTQGPVVGEFEKALAKKVGARYTVAVANGTAALHLAAIVLGLKKGDEVITTPISFLATANAALYVGAKPVFVDIDPETQCIDPAKIEAKITRRTQAIFFTDFAGHPAELKKIRAIADRHGLAVVEDSAHALGSLFQGSRVGSCRYADMSIFSFHPVKHITTGEGGAITTQSRVHYERLCMLRSHGVTRHPQKLLDRHQGRWYYEMQDLGFNYRLTDIQAALGLEQLKRLPDFVRRRREIAGMYRRAFQGLQAFEIPVEKPKCLHAYHLFVIRLRGAYAAQRKEIFQALQERGIGVQVHYIPIPAQPYYRRLGYAPGDCPAAQAFYRSAISLPIYPKMTDAQVRRVIRTVQAVCRLF